MTEDTGNQADGPRGRAQRIAAWATAVPAEERRAFVDAATANDAGLRTQALAQLGLDEPGPAEPGEDLGAPRRVGPYALQRRLGVGGMGAVYLAERDDGAFQRRVALKLIHPGRDVGDLLTRFQRERQVLANLDHRGIAALLDGGKSADGAPYLVLEYVAGTPIDEYCEARELSVDARLDLFVAVCEAVSHAHHSLVVHRDLKPSNILVTEDGEPKLLDFGIAEVLDPEKRSLRSTGSRELSRFLTPAFASPEQVRGLPVTPATDQYSLGVLLYLLLARCLPFDLRGRSPVEIERITVEETPARPSVACPPELRRVLAGDLERIVLTALRKEPRRRYASVAALAEDVRRYRQGRAVLAQGDAWSYQAGKVVAKYRAHFAFSGTILVLLVAGLAFSLERASAARAARGREATQRQLAERRQRELFGFTRSLLSELSSEIAEVPGAARARAMIVDTGLHYLDKLGAQAQDDPDLLAGVARGYLEIGRILSESTTGGAAALASFEKASGVADTLVTGWPERADGRELRERARAEAARLRPVEARGSTTDDRPIR